MKKINKFILKFFIAILIGASSMMIGASYKQEWIILAGGYITCLVINYENLLE